MEETASQVHAALTEILSELGVEPEAIRDSAVLGADLELDSTDAVEVGLELKRRFNVTVKVHVKGGETVGDLTKLVLEELIQSGS
jgi:acyl carrier protein